MSSDYNRVAFSSAREHTFELTAANEFGSTVFHTSSNWDLAGVWLLQIVSIFDHLGIREWRAIRPLVIDVNSVGIDLPVGQVDQSAIVPLKLKDSGCWLTIIYSVVKWTSFENVVTVSQNFNVLNSIFRHTTLFGLIWGLLRLIFSFSRSRLWLLFLYLCLDFDFFWWIWLLWLRWRRGWFGVFDGQPLDFFSLLLIIGSIHNIKLLALLVLDLFLDFGLVFIFFTWLFLLNHMVWFG